jgi:phage shock protein PspC (stress-responsive transcriptional regulator)
MSEQSPTPSAPLGRHDLRNLRRSSSDRMIAGVCGGLGRYTGVDPVVFRITLAVLAVFGGAGLVLYAIGWLLIPDDTATQSEAQRLVRGRGAVFTLFAFGIGVLGVIALGAMVGHGWPGPFPAIILAAAIGALIVYRHGYGEPSPSPQQQRGTAGGAPLGPPPGYSASSTTEAPQAAPTTTGPTYTAPSYTAPSYTAPGDEHDEPWLSPPPPPPAPAPRRPPSFLGPIGFSLGLVVAGVLLAIGASGAFDISAQGIFAAALLTVGLVLIAGAWFGRSRALIAWGAVLTAALVLAAAANVPLRGGIGNRHDTPISATDLQSSYHLGVGNQMLDLAQLELNGATRHVAATVGIGDLDVAVPANVKVVVHARSGAGELQLFDRSFGGTQLDRTMTMAATGNQAGVLDLDLRVGLGQVHIWHAPAFLPVPNPQGAQS